MNGEYGRAPRGGVWWAMGQCRGRAVWAVAMLLAAACSGAAEGGGTQDGGDATGGAEVDGDGGPGQGALAWVPFGPADPNTPLPEVRHYHALFERRCEDVLSDEDSSSEDLLRLYRGAAFACLGDWAEAEAALAAVQGMSFDAITACLDRETFRLLDDLVQAHKADPTSAPEVVDAAPGRVACTVTPWITESPSTDSSPTPSPAPTAPDGATPSPAAPTAVPTETAGAVGGAMRHG